MSMTDEEREAIAARVVDEVENYVRAVFGTDEKPNMKMGRLRREGAEYVLRYVRNHAHTWVAEDQ